MNKRKIFIGAFVGLFILSIASKSKDSKIRSGPKKIIKRIVEIDPLLAIKATNTQNINPNIFDIIKGTAKAYKVPLHISLGVAKVESNFRTNLTSPKGAQGLYQLMPITQETFGVTDPFDPEQNANAGNALLGMLYKRYGSWKNALYAYNWGHRNLDTNPNIPDSVERYFDKVMTAAEKYI